MGFRIVLPLFLNLSNRLSKHTQKVILFIFINLCGLKNNTVPYGLFDTECHNIFNFKEH